ncbi:ABC transporter ATP-binding protein [Chamaesiphon sp. OTE_20_metabat_361]|uniref:ABC transporter ATP-binding protein n=1 Tax=Chamaesiphon sp. OTE_20_metabat_361 TaxID=2964689 RepID=UPI00286CD3F0|nr:ABC transporter ATP-binding protein [Chamaesiphon sp. OTE_20_metabat_361]
MTLLAFVLISGLEILGTGIIGPFIAIATHPEFIASNRWLNLAYITLNFSSERQFLLGLGALAIATFYIKAFLSFQAQKSVFQFGYNLKRDLSCKLMQAYLAAPYSFHLNINSANLIQDIISTTDNVCLGVVMPLLTSISNLLVTLALTILLIQTDAFALILIGMLLLAMLVLSQAMKHRLVRWGKEGWQAAGEMIRILNHGLGGLKETRVIGCEAYFQQQMEEQSAKFATNLTLSQSYGNLPRYAIEALMLTFLVGFTLLFVTLNRGDRDLGAVLGIFGLAAIRLLPASGNLVSGLNVMRANSFAVDKLYFDLQQLEREVPLPIANTPAQAGGKMATAQREQMSFTREIALEGINFQYSQHPRLVLEDISLTIAKGQSIGIIGKSGSGKTTLVDVILGLFLPQSGDIKVDGRSVYRDLRAWQNILGYVPQSIFLTDDTLERNIAFGVADGSIDRLRLQQAIEMAQLQDVVENLPNGIHTMVGERGVLLSGGQRQRVGIARVLYHQREVLVFDEATAALDNETEQLVTAATKALSRSKTIIIIAHRLSTIEHCDCIYQIDRGRILKSGSYQEVVLGQ